MNEEELTIARLELARRGYRRFYIFSCGYNCYGLRARKYDPATKEGMAETLIEILTPEDLAPYLEEPPLPRP